MSYRKETRSKTELHMKSANDEDTFSPALVQKLLDRLESNPLPHLTPNEEAHLSVLIETTLEVGPNHHYPYSR